MVTETKKKMEQDIERHKEALKVLEQEKELNPTRNLSIEREAVGS